MSKKNLFSALQLNKSDLEAEVERLKKSIVEDMQQPLIAIETDRDQLKLQVHVLIALLTTISQQLWLQRASKGT